MNGPSDPTQHQMDPKLEAALEAILGPLSRYHDHQVVGLDNVPRSGGVLMAFSHSFATYDGFLTGHKIYHHTGRLPLALGDNLIFRIPALRKLAWDIGIRPGNHENGQALLAQGAMLMLAPGGMRESLRPSTHYGKVEWGRRKGFVRLAIRAQAPVQLVACGAADEIYLLKQNRVTSLAYERLKIPVPLAMGRRGTPIPRKVPLRAFISPLFHPPELDEENFEAQVTAFHTTLVSEMQALMQKR
ncbi:MAG: lysophospholipid acyltransferase family protein [Myxococcota bacterium]|nr:lysophospholipid acyltransferase family protein [Myxococcota bacterium]